MRYQRPSRERGEKRTDSLGGDAERESREVEDERTLYGEPCHEVRPERDEQTLYGEPQHETSEESRELPDLDLLLARLRAESTTGPTAYPTQSGNSQLKTTEQ